MIAVATARQLLHCELLGQVCFLHGLRDLHRYSAGTHGLLSTLAVLLSTLFLEMTVSANEVVNPRASVDRS